MIRRNLTEKTHDKKVWSRWFGKIQRPLEYPNRKLSHSSLGWFYRTIINLLEKQWKFELVCINIYTDVTRTPKTPNYKQIIFCDRAQFQEERQALPMNWYKMGVTVTAPLMSLQCHQN